MKLFIQFFLLPFLFNQCAWSAESLPILPAPQEEPQKIATRSEASVIGWGNLFVPGLGATLSGQPFYGLQEATTEVGLYYGGTFGVKEGNFQIDGSISVPHASKLTKPLVGQLMQEAGLKYHFYNTFKHYRESVLRSDLGRPIDSTQPVYRGELKDIFAAPFQWSNLSSWWVFPLVGVSAGYLVYNYKTSGATHYADLHVSSLDETLYGVGQGIVIPLGGLVGEEPLFRGFIMREMRAYSNSLAVALLLESAAFTALHPRELRLSAFASAVYFGIMTDHFNGNLEPAIAAHFWVNVVSGVVSYWLMRREQNKQTPFQPPIILETTLPF